MVELDYPSLISTVGFPIVAFFMMYFLTRSTIQKNTEVIQKLEVTIASFMSKKK